MQLEDRQIITGLDRDFPFGRPHVSCVLAGLCRRGWCYVFRSSGAAAIDQGLEDPPSVANREIGFSACSIW